MPLRLSDKELRQLQKTHREKLYHDFPDLAGIIQKQGRELSKLKRLVSGQQVQITKLLVAVSELKGR